MPPANANEPDSSRRCISIASDIIPTGMRMTSAMASKRGTSGWRKNAA
jgi:hypothetical protein